MLRIIMGFLAVFFPWVFFLLKDNAPAAFLALILQITAIGWPVASLWAWRTFSSPKTTTNDTEKSTNPTTKP